MRITHAKPLDHFRVSLCFDNGASGIVDLSHLAGCGVFRTWLQDGAFEQLFISPVGALEWPGEIDLCPDSLYMQMVGKTTDEVFPSLRDELTHA